MSTALENTLHARANDGCELCKSTELLAPFAVAPFEDLDAEHNVLLCAACTERLAAEELDASHWFGVRESIWSEHAPVQVLSFRILHRLADVWAKELLEQAYLTDETREWAMSGVKASAPTGPRTLDSNGAELNDGDSVTLIKDLDVKGASFVATRGTLVSRIRLTENPEHVEGKVNGITLVLKTAFLKKA